MLPPYYLYWFRIDNKHMTEPWLDQALMDSAYRSKAEACKYFLREMGRSYCTIPVLKILNNYFRLINFFKGSIICTSSQELMRKKLSFYEKLFYKNCKKIVENNSTWIKKENETFHILYIPFPAASKSIEFEGSQKKCQIKIIRFIKDVNKHY